MSEEMGNLKLQCLKEQNKNEIKDLRKIIFKRDLVKIQRKYSGKNGKITKALKSGTSESILVNNLYKKHQRSYKRKVESKPMRKYKILN